MAPGQGGMAPGQGGMVPGQGGMVPGQGGMVPGQGGVAPGRGGVLPGQGGVVPVPNQRPAANANSPGAGSGPRPPQAGGKARRKLIRLESLVPDVIPSIPMVGLEKLNINKNPPWGRDVLCVILPTKLLVNFTLRRLPDAEMTEDTDYDQWSLTSANQRYDESPCIVLEDGLSQTVSRYTTAWLKPDAKIFLREKKAADTPHLGFRAVFEAAPQPASPTELPTGVQQQQQQQQQPRAAPASRSSSSSSSSVPSRTTEGLAPTRGSGGSAPSHDPSPPAAVTAPSGVDEEWFQAVMAAFDNAPRPGGKKKRKLAEADVVDLVDSDDDEGDSPPSPAAATNDDDNESAYLDLQCAVCQCYMYNAVSVWPCLHCYCSSCIGCWVKKDDHCPQCRTRVEAIRPNLGISNLIEALSVKKKIIGRIAVQLGLPWLITTLSLPSDQRTAEDRKAADDVDILKHNDLDEACMAENNSSALVYG
ncbi:hypothetical protein FOZ63_015618 [Perkinsus olseni]|uniref:RING-type domain-containing protein n=1 Tax=Perkinsus olseni TaxID=32597 RepID=A0A7J6TML0_PEROL|nr:hypothetical protein FOZ63_015618 [Perkinsus olseni]